MVDAPISFSFRPSLVPGRSDQFVWRILEDPAIYQRSETERNRVLGEPWAAEAAPALCLFSWKNLNNAVRSVLLARGKLLRGYFKWPELQYSCEGVKRLLFRLQAAAEEIEEDLSAYEPQRLTETRHEWPHL
jgi:hypothetical protein